MYTRYYGISLTLMAVAEAGLLARQTQSCPAVPAVTVAPYVVEYPLYINTYISANTVINIDRNGNNITINNAPTSLDLLTTGTSAGLAIITPASGLGSAGQGAGGDNSGSAAVNGASGTLDGNAAGASGTLGGNAAGASTIPGAAVNDVPSDAVT